jgi:hypothetical protein
VTKHMTDYKNNRKGQNNVAVFYVCSLEDAVCSEIQDKDTLQDGVCHNVSYCKRTQPHTVEYTRKYISNTETIS